MSTAQEDRAQLAQIMQAFKDRDMDGGGTIAALENLCESFIAEKASAEAGAVAFGYFNELLDHEGKGNGVWLGCNDRNVTEQAYIEGEVGKEVVTLYTHPASIEEIRRAAEVMGYMLCRWEPIETAPKDGSEIVTKDGDTIAMSHWDAEKYNGPYWFDYRYDDMWGDRPTRQHPDYWLSGLTAPKEPT